MLLSCTGDNENKIVIGIIRPSLNHLPFDFGLAAKFLDRNDYIIKKFNSGWETNEALIAGKLDLAILPFTYIWLDVSKGKEVKIISFFERESDGIIARPGITTLAQLEGKKLGVLRGSTLDIFAEILLEDKKLNMEIIYFRTPMDMAAALKAKEVDALSYYVPSIFKFPGDYNIVYWYGDDHPLHPCCDIAVTDKALESKYNSLKNFMTGIKTATNELNNSPDTAFKAVEEFYSLYPPYSKYSLYQTKYILALDDTMKNFEYRSFNKMIEKGYVDKMVKLENVYYNLK